MTEPERDQWAEWLLSRRHGGDPARYDAEVQGMYPLRDTVLEHAQIAQGDTVLDVGAGDGLIAFGAVEQVGEHGLVIFSDISPYLLQFCRSVAERRGLLGRCRFVEAAAEDLSAIGDTSVNVVTVRSVLIYVKEKARAFQEFHRVLKPKGRLSIFEPINRFGYFHLGDRFLGYDVSPISELVRKVCAAFEEIQPPDSDPMLDFDERDLFTLAENAGFAQINLEYQATVKSFGTSYRWEELIKRAGNPRIPTLEEAINQALTPGEVQQFVDHLRPLVEAGQGRTRGAQAFLWAAKG